MSRPGETAAEVRSHVVASKANFDFDCGRRSSKPKHPVMAGREELVKQTLTSPEQIRRSRKDAAVHLHYRKDDGHYCCVVVKHLNGDGFVVTTYLTGKIKAGEAVV